MNFNDIEKLSSRHRGLIPRAKLPRQTNKLTTPRATEDLGIEVHIHMPGYSDPQEICGGTRPGDSDVEKVPPGERVARMVLPEGLYD